MKNELILVRLNPNYCDYLRKFDSKVPYNYGDKKLRPFVGVLFMIDELMYFAPLSSPKPKHIKLKAKLDLLKIRNGEMGVINFNNMLPVTNKNVTKIDLKKILYSNAGKKYYKLLDEQYFWLNRNRDMIYGRAEKLYEKYISGTLEKKIVQRCCNFKLLEEKCIEYNKKE